MAAFRGGSSGSVSRASAATNTRLERLRGVLGGQFMQNRGDIPRGLRIH
jgi:hypothetical protein